MSDAVQAASPLPMGAGAGPAEMWTDAGPHPFRRWVARAFDNYVVTGLVLGVLSAPWAALPIEGAGLPLGVAAALYLVPPARGLVSSLINAWLLARFGLTPGKWLCGVRITGDEGRPSSFGDALKRELDVFLRGCALYLPLFAPLAMAWSFFALRRKGVTSWDAARRLTVVHRPRGPRQALMTTAAFIPAAAVILASLAAAAIFTGAA